MKIDLNQPITSLSGEPMKLIDSNGKQAPILADQIICQCIQNSNKQGKDMFKLISLGERLASDGKTKLKDTEVDLLTEIIEEIVPKLYASKDGLGQGNYIASKIIKMLQGD